MTNTVLLSFNNSLYILNANYAICKSFLPFCALDTIVLGTEVSNFNLDQLNYYFATTLLMSYPGNNCLLKGHKDSCLCFLLRVL